MLSNARFCYRGRVSEAPEVHDPVDLRQRIVVCFTLGELRELGEELGVSGSVRWDRGIQEAAREVVRQCERYAGLPALVAKLRKARPDMDWPAVAAAPAAAAAASIAPLPATPGTLEPRALDPAGDIADPFAPVAPPPTVAGAPAFVPIPPLSGPGTVASSGTAPASFAPPPIAPAPSPIWPGTIAPAASAPSRGVDPRVLVAVAGLMLLAAVIAYLAGRASSGGDASAAPAGSGSALPRRVEGPAALAAEVIARSFDNLARTCELPASAADALVFRRVFDRCGPTPLPPRPRLPDLEPIVDDPSPRAPREPREPREPTPPRPRRPNRNGGDVAPPDPVPAARGCDAACNADLRTCKQRCGPEPSESAAYDGYQRCHGRCLSDVSRCRLACR